MAVTFRQVVPFAITLGSSATSVTKTLTGGDVILDTSKSFLMWGMRGDSVTPQAGHIQARITSTTTIVFDREAHNSEVVEIFCYLCEFTAGVLVERGVILDSDFDGGTGGEFTVDLASITSLTTSFTRFSIIGVGAGGTFDQDDMYSVYLTEAGGTVTIHAELGDVSTADHNLAWEVIQYDDCAVQRGNTTAMGSSTTFVEILLSSVVDPAKSFIQVSAKSTQTGTDIGRIRLRGRHTVASVSGDEITIDRDHSASKAIADIRWEVVEFTGSETVQEVLETFASADGQEDFTLTAVSGLANAAVTASFNGRAGQSAYSANDNQFDSTFTAELTTTTNLQTKRGATNAASLVAFYVIDFGAGAGGISIPVVQHHRAMQGVF